MKLKDILDRELKIKNSFANLYFSPDPLQVARKYKDEYIALLCSLFAYGNAKMIVKFLNSLPFELLESSDKEIENEILKRDLKYRFQTAKDIANIFITLKRAKNENLEELIKSGFEHSGQIIDGINAVIKKFYSLNSFSSSGYEFFFGREFAKEPKSPYKRYNMWLRWMIRDSDIDLGLFKKLPKSELILPLDTHTHRVSLSLGLCSRKSYDYKSALEITKNLRNFDRDDPIKYDFAIYRIGQSKELENILSIINS